MALHMILQRFSMRTSMALTILAMGILAMLLALFTGEIYRQLALENQRAAFETIIELKTKQLLDESYKKMERLGLTLQNEKPFRSAFDSRDRNAIEMSLNENFHRFYVTTEQLDVRKFVIFDMQFNIIATSTEHSSGSNDSINPCPNLTNQAHQREGAERLKIMTSLCAHQGNPLIASVIPIGGLKLKGYVLVVANPSLNIRKVEEELAMPLTLTNMNQTNIYNSKHWPETNTKENVLIVDHILKSEAGQPALKMSLAYDIESLHQQLEKTRIFIMLAATVATFIAALLSLMLLKRTVLSPLGRLTEQLNKVKIDKTYLAEKLAVEGNLEVRSLATGFNEMGKELHHLYQTLEEMAYTDALTGLPNRTLFYDRLEQLALINLREERPFSILMMDLNRFKLINDTLGHHVGDKLLKIVSERLVDSMVRKSDTIARLGGDEFAAILPQVSDCDSAAIVAKRISEALDQPVSIDGRSFTIGISIGIVACPYHGKDGNELIQRADVAMYHAKKNQQPYAWYESEFDTHHIDQLTLDSELKQAISTGGLELHYQPKIDFQTQRIKSVEALVRWIHPEQGFIPPDRFIPVAEQTGLIHPLTHWVINTALGQISAWQRDHAFLNVAVNLSALSLRDSTLESMVKNALKTADVSPEHLTLELTESAIMSDPQRALDTLTHLDQMGVSISVDDFGTGYSSLAYLKRLPVDELKIDRSFVMDMDNDTNDEVIVRSTIDLAHNMGLKVIAEGIETERSWDKLLEMGCDMGQGYYMCRPLKADDLNDWLRNSPWGLH